MLKIFFPIILQLHILQLEEYDVSHFITWIFNNFFKRTIQNKKKLIWTTKAKLIFFLSIILIVFVSIILSFKFYVLGFIISLLLASQTYLFLSVATLLLKPIELFLKKKIKNKTFQKVHSFKNLKIIGITGSYGKTSVKEFLYQILKQEFKVLKTPGSYNTLLGISKVVDLELDNTYDFFVVEMGAYRRGEIKELCEMVTPHFSMLTGINEQHLETFGSIENTIAGKFEIIDALQSNGIGVVNIDNEFIKNNISKYKKTIIGYGFSSSLFSIKNIHADIDGSSFELLLDGKAYKISTTLIGNSNLLNILGVATMAYKIGMKPAAITQAIKNLKPVAHRLQLKIIGKTIIIDDAYNSNTTGFREALATLQLFKEKKKILVTPGIVQLGHKTHEIHKALGMLADDSCDQIYLVGKSDRTVGLAEGISHKEKITYLENLKPIFEGVEKGEFENSVLLLENDLPDNF